MFYCLICLESPLTELTIDYPFKETLAEEGLSSCTRALCVLSKSKERFKLSLPASELFADEASLRGRCFSRGSTNSFYLKT